MKPGKLGLTLYEGGAEGAGPSPQHFSLAESSQAWDFIFHPFSSSTHSFSFFEKSYERDKIKSSSTLPSQKQLDKAIE
jgi:hypothetical protein